MTSPPSPVNRQHLCSRQASSCARCSVSWLAIDEMFALEWATYPRSFPAQPSLSFWQRYNRRKCAYLLRDLAATADLRPILHSFPFSSWTLHTGGSERQDNNIHIFDALSSTSFFSKPLARWPICMRQSQDSLPVASPTPHRRCTQGGQFSKLSLRSIAPWKSSTTSLQLIRQHGQLQQSRRPLFSLVPPSLLTVRTLPKRTGPALYLGLQTQSRGSFDLVSSPVRSGSVSNWQESA